MNDFSYSVLVVTYNRLAKLKKCIECINAQTLRADSIIVIDNNSSDNTEEYLDEIAAGDKRYNIVHMEENLGGAGGFARGVEEFSNSSTQWLIMIDDDAMLRADYAEAVANRIALDDMADGQVAYAGAVYENGDIALNHRRVLTRDFINKEQPLSKELYDEACFECDQATFCGLVVNKETVKQIGLPRAEFFIWYDDTEYSMRIRKTGKIIVVPAAAIDHECVNPEGGSNLAVFVRFKEKEYYGVRNRLIVSREYYSGMTTCYMALFIFARIVKQRLWAIASINNKENLEAARYNIRLLKQAYRDGVSGKTARFGR